MTISTSNHHTPWTTINLTMAMAQSIQCLGCLVFAIYHYVRHNRRKDDKSCTIYTIIPISTFLALISFFLGSLSQILHFWTWMSWIDIHRRTEITICAIISIFCWSFGQFCSYLVFYCRLITVFSESSYRVSMLITIYLMIFLILYETAWITKCVLALALWSDGWTREYCTIQVYLTISILILDVFISISMIYLFISRLFRVMRGHIDSVDDSNLRMDILDRSLNVNGPNHQMMNLSVRITVLSSVSLLSSLIFVSLDAVAISQNFHGTLNTLASLWLQIDTIISCFCLTLFLGKTKRFYTIFCAGCNMVGHWWMRRFLLKWRKSRRRDTDSSLLSAPSGAWNVRNMQTDSF